LKKKSFAKIQSSDTTRARKVTLICCQCRYEITVNKSLGSNENTMPKRKTKEKTDFMADINMPCDEFVNALQNTLNCNYQYTSTSLEKSSYTYLSHSTKHADYSLYHSIIQAVPTQISWRAEQITSGKTHLTAKFGLSKSIKLRLLLIIAYTNVIFCIANLVLFKNSSVVQNRVFAIHSILSLSFLIVLGTLSARYTQFLRTVIKNSIAGESGIKWHVNIASNPKFRSLVTPDLYWFAALLYIGILVIYYSKGIINTKIVSIFAPNLITTVIVLVISLPLLLLFTNRYLSGIIHSSKFMPICLNFFLAIIFIFFLYVPPTLTKAIMESFVEHVNSAAIEESINVPDQYYADAKKTLVSSYVQQFITKYFLLHTISYLVCFSLLYRVGYQLSGFLGGARSTHQKQLEQLIDDNKGSSSALLWTAKVSVLGLFIFLSFILWKNIVIYISIVNLYVTPDHWLIQTSDAKAIMDATNEITQMAVKNFANSETEDSMRFKLLLPVIIPPTVFLCFHIRSSLRKASKKYVPLKGDHMIVMEAKRIASRIGQSPVFCLIDRTSNRTEIRAEFGGWFPQNRIIFTHRSVKFLEDNVELIEVIIAHEMAHLKYDCKKFWLTERLSRIGLVGSAFLSVIHDSAAIERRAHNTALAYAKGSGAAEKLIDKAIYLMGLEKYNDSLDREAQKPYSSSIKAKLKKLGDSLLRVFHFSITRTNWLLRRIPKYSSHIEPKLPSHLLKEMQKDARYFVFEVVPKGLYVISNTIKNKTHNFHLILKFYFELDWYDYIHGNRNAPIRGKIHEEAEETATTSYQKER
jgi:hypothetical protein